MNGNPNFLNAREMKEFQSMDPRSFTVMILSAMAADPKTAQQLQAISRGNFTYMMASIQHGEKLPTFIELLIAVNFPDLMKQYMRYVQPSDVAMNAVIDGDNVDLKKEAVRLERFSEEQLIRLIEKCGGKEFIPLVNKLALTGRFFKFIKERNIPEEQELLKKNRSDYEEMLFAQNNRKHLLKILKEKEYKFSDASKAKIIADVQLATACFLGKNGFQIEVQEAVALRRKGLKGEALECMCQKLYHPWLKLSYDDFKNDHEFFVVMLRNNNNCSWSDIWKIVEWGDVELVKLSVENYFSPSDTAFNPIYQTFGVDILEFIKEKTGVIPEEVQRFDYKKDTDKVLFCIENQPSKEELFGCLSVEYHEGVLLKAKNARITKAYIKKFGIEEDNEKLLDIYKGKDFIEIVEIVSTGCGFKTWEGMKIEQQYGSKLRAKAWREILKAILLLK